MAHANAPLTPEGRRRLIERIKKPGYTYLHAAVDDNSRLAYVECHDNERAVTGFEPVTSILTDNGSAYISGAWKAALAEHHIKHRRTRRQTPQTNGKVERFNRTMKDEWLYVRSYTSEIDRRNHLVPFLNYYNHDRPHSRHRQPSTGQPSARRRTAAHP